MSTTTTTLANEAFLWAKRMGEAVVEFVYGNPTRMWMIVTSLMVSLVVLQLVQTFLIAPYCGV